MGKLFFSFSVWHLCGGGCRDGFVSTGAVMLGDAVQVARRGARGGVSRCETSGRVVSPGERSQGFD